jgi:hypothetical protein
VANADEGEEQSGEIFLNQVRARAIDALCFLMVDCFNPETLMQLSLMLVAVTRNRFPSRYERE